MRRLLHNWWLLLLLHHLRRVLHLIVELRRLLELWLHRQLIHHRRGLVLRLLEPVEGERLLLKLLLRWGHVVLGGLLLIVEDPILRELILLLELAWILLRDLMGLATSSPSPPLIRLRRSRLLLLLSHLLLQLYPILPLLVHLDLLPLLLTRCLQEELLLLLYYWLLLFLRVILLILHESPIRTDISAWLLEDLSEDLVTEIFFTGAGEYGLNFTRGGLGV